MLLSSALLASVLGGLPGAMTSTNPPERYANFSSEFRYSLAGAPDATDQHLIVLALAGDLVDALVVLLPERAKLGAVDPYDATTDVRIQADFEDIEDGIRSAALVGTPALQVDFHSGVIAPANTLVSNESKLSMPISLSNPTGAPITTSLTINAGLDSKGTYPAFGSLFHSGAAALVDTDPENGVFLGPTETWFETFSSSVVIPNLGLIDNIDFDFPEPGRWHATGDGSVSYEITLQPGETINKWLYFSAKVGIFNGSDAGPAQYDAVNDPGLFSYSVVIDDPSVVFDIIPTPGTVSVVPIAACLVGRRRRR